MDNIQNHKIGRFLMREESQNRPIIRKPSGHFEKNILACIPNGDTTYYNFYIIYVLYEDGYANSNISHYKGHAYEYGFDFITIDEYLEQVKEHPEYVFRDI